MRLPVLRSSTVRLWKRPEPAGSRVYRQCDLMNRDVKASATRDTEVRLNAGLRSSTVLQVPLPKAPSHLGLK